MQRDTNASVQEKDYFSGSYEIIEPIGRGRNSVVYLAESVVDPEKGSKRSPEICALKVIIENVKDPKAGVARVRKEALALLSCVHENVIRLFDYVAEPDNSFLALEYAEKGDLASLMKSGSVSLDPVAVVRLMVQVLSGLEAVHRAGIIHRDIKPENLLLTDACIIKIADFGIAAFKNEKITTDDANRGVGTFEYLAPETLEEGVCDELTDLYSVAVCLYQLLTGVIPFSTGSFAQQIDDKMNSSVTAVQQRASEVSDSLAFVVHKALQSERSKRYGSLVEFRAALQSLLPEGQSAPIITSISEVRPESDPVVQLVPEEVFVGDMSQDSSSDAINTEISTSEQSESGIGDGEGVASTTPQSRSLAAKFLINHGVVVAVAMLVMLGLVFLKLGDRRSALANDGMTQQQSQLSQPTSMIN